MTDHAELSDLLETGDAIAELEIEANEAADAPAPPPARTVGRNISALAIGQAITWILSLVWTLYVPRLLGPDEMGILVTATAVAGIGGILLGQGTKVYIVRELVANPDQSEQLLGTVIVLRMILLPLLLAGIGIYGHFSGYDAKELTVLWLATASMFLIFMAEPMQAAFQAAERMEYLAYTSVVDEAVQAGLGVLLAVLGFGARGLVACAAIVTGLMLIVNVLWARRFVRISLRTSRQQVAKVLKESAAYWVFGLFFMVYLWIDTTLLSLMTNNEAVAWYGVPTKLFTSLMFLPVIFSTAWLPRLVSAHERGLDALHREARRPLELVILCSLPICVVAAMTAKPLIDLLYGAEYRKAAPVMAVLAFVVPAMYVNIMLNQVLVAAQRQKVWTFVMAGATVVNPIFNVILIKVCDHHYANGALGAAISLLLTEILMVSVGIVVAGRGVISRGSLGRVARAAAAALVMAGAMWLVRDLEFILEASVGAIVFVVAGLVLRVLSDEEREWLVGRIGRIGAAVRAKVGAG